MGSHQGSYFQMTIQPLCRENLKSTILVLIPKELVGSLLIGHSENVNQA
jgi:hypothetical protein